MNDTAKGLWDTAIEHLEAATNHTDPLVSNAYVAIGELALKAAQFALNNHALIMGINEDALPGSRPNVMPPGAPAVPTWGRQ
jgi:hypothetical protein